MLQDFKNWVWMCFFFWFIVLTSNGPFQYTQLQHLISLKSLSPLFSPSSQATLRKVWLTSNPFCHSKITKACLSIPPETPNARHPGPPSHRLTPSLLKDFIALWPFLFPDHQPLLLHSIISIPIQTCSTIANLKTK